MEETKSAIHHPFKIYIIRDKAELKFYSIGPGFNPWTNPPPKKLNSKVLFIISLKIIFTKIETIKNMLLDISFFIVVLGGGTLWHLQKFL
jgi:hypothetical protein